ncbi:MAG: ECF transporter S component [Christensenellales bacterium]
MNKNSLTIKKMALAAIFLVFGWILPLVTGRIPEIGNMLCPMHIPVMLCGFILGPWYGLIIGFITPLTRGFILECQHFILQEFQWLLNLQLMG